MKNRFSDQVAIVTGGASGIGKAVAERLAAEGASVVIFDRDRELAETNAREFSSEGLSVEAAQVDIADEESVRSSIEKVVSKHGGLDVMVNCAGIVGPTSVNIVEYETDAFDEIYAINQRGSFLMTKYAIQPMLEKDYGRILLYASIGGKEGNPGQIGYAATKSAVMGLVKGVGKEYAQTGVTINGIAPAVIRTSMVENCDPEMVKYMVDRIPMKRTGLLEEAAAMTAFIVSRECSFSTGAIFDLSGGRATY
jgi:NAD(P)-dependent dehydrogenase (short-subunit alcohol dehydrogenase family)